MFVQQPKQIDDGRHWHRLASFIAGECVVPAPGQTRRRDLTEAELAADAANLLAPPLPLAQRESVSRRRVTPRAFGVELDFATGPAAPTRQVLDGGRLPRMLDGEGFAFEPGQTVLVFAVQTISSHGHNAANWITGAASRKVILM
jgi:hypothetical protein